MYNDCSSFFTSASISKVPIHFSWDVPDGFEISPESDSLSPKQTCKLTATFKPRSAVVYSTSAVCIFSSKLEAIDKPFNQESDCVKKKLMKLEGIGKYPHVTVKLCSGKKVTSPHSRQGTKVNTTPGTTAPSTLNTRFVCDEGDGSGEGGCSSRNETVVNFGAVAVGSVVKKRIEITNVSPVSPYPYTPTCTSCT